VPNYVKMNTTSRIFDKLRIQRLISVSALFILLSTLLLGCSSQTRDGAGRAIPEGSYCVNGGRENNYSCEAASPNQALPMHTRPVDEVWMYETLEEIRDWLNEQKHQQQHKPSS